MMTHAHRSETRPSTRSGGSMPRPAGSDCRLRAVGRRLAAALVAIDEVWARVVVAPGQAGLEPGEAVELDLVLPDGSSQPLHVSGFIIDRLGNELWLRFSTPPAVPLPDLQSYLQHRATA